MLLLLAVAVNVLAQQMIPHNDERLHPREYYDFWGTSLTEMYRPIIYL